MPLARGGVGVAKPRAVLVESAPGVCHVTEHTQPYASENAIIERDLEPCGFNA